MAAKLLCLVGQHHLGILYDQLAHIVVTLVVTSLQKALNVEYPYGTLKGRGASCEAAKSARSCV